MKFSQRVTLSVVVPATATALLAVGAGGASLWAEARLNNYFEHLDKQAAAVTEMYAQGLQMGQSLRNVVLNPEDGKAVDNYKAAQKLYAEADAEARAAGVPESQALLAAATTSRSKLQAVQLELLDLAKTDTSRSAARLKTEETPQWRELRTALLDLKRQSTEQRADWISQTRTLLRRA